jgi:uncharacterized membrane protein YqjE
MVDQASVRDGGPQPTTAGNGAPEQRVLGGIAGFSSDLTTLVELQVRLAILDLKESSRRALVPLVTLSAGVVVAIGAVTVALMGVSELLAAALNIRPPWAMLLTAGVAIVWAAAAAALAATRIGPCFASFRRSAEELTRNVAWIRTVLLYSGRDVSRRGR